MNERIRKIRKDAGLTMEAFGEKIGMVKSSVSQIESGKNGASDTAVKMICTVFNVDEHWLRTGEGEPYIELSEHEQIMQRLAKVQFVQLGDGPDDLKAIANFKERLASAILALDDAGCDAMMQLLDDMGYVKKTGD